MKRVWIAVALAAAAACAKSPREAIMRKAITDTSRYFNQRDFQGMALEKVGERVWSYRWTWYRNLVVVTDEGLVVVDPFNEEAARGLKSEIGRVFPGKKVKTLIYSHHHLDHVRGGAILEPEEVIAHEDCPDRWKELGAEDDVLPATKLIEGDQTLTIGGVELKLLYMGNSHSDTMYAVHVPSERVLFAADLAPIRTLPPFGGPDVYNPGYIAALERLVAIDFDDYIPSHFQTGEKEDLEEYVAMYKDCHSMARAAVRRQGGKAPRSKDELAMYFDELYPEMKKKYGHWRGFDDMAIQLLIRNVTGEVVGF